MNEKRFYETYCEMCGSQRCMGIGTEWFDGCAHRDELDGYVAPSDAPHTINSSLNNEDSTYYSSNFLKVSEEDMEKFCKAVRAVGCTLKQLDQYCQEFLNALHKTE